MATPEKGQAERKRKMEMENYNVLNFESGTVARLEHFPHCPHTHTHHSGLTCAIYIV